SNGIPDLGEGHRDGRRYADEHGVAAHEAHAGDQPRELLGELWTEKREPRDVDEERRRTGRDDVRDDALACLRHAFGIESADERGNEDAVPYLDDGRGEAVHGLLLGLQCYELFVADRSELGFELGLTLEERLMDLLGVDVREHHDPSLNRLVGG